MGRPEPQSRRGFPIRKPPVLSVFIWFHLVGSSCRILEICLPQPLRRDFSFWNQSQRPALVSVRKTGILPRVMQSKTGMAQPRPSAGGAGLFLDPNMALGRAKNPPNVPHQYLDRHRYLSHALRRYSVPDARKRPFAYLCRRPFRPGVPTLSPIFSEMSEEEGHRLSRGRP